MKLAMSVLILTASCCGNLAQGQPSRKAAVRLEFRRAETTPAKDLQEATVPGMSKKIYLHKEPEITNADIAEASLDEKDEREPRLSLKFTRQGQQKIEKLSKDHRNKPLAILVDGKLLIAPVIRSALSESVLIGGVDREEMERIVKGLKAR